MEDKKKLRITVISVFATISLLIVGIVALFFKVNSQPTDSYTQTEEVDPVSGETVYRTEGKTPEKVGQNPNAPLVLGLVKFYDRGLSQSEVEAIKASFTDYANQRITKKQEKIEQISVNGESITHGVSRNSDLDTYTADLVINQKDPAVLVIELKGLSLMTTKIYLGNEIAGEPDFTITKSL